MHELVYRWRKWAPTQRAAYNHKYFTLQGPCSCKVIVYCWWYTTREDLYTPRQNEKNVKQNTVVTNIVIYNSVITIFIKEKYKKNSKVEEITALYTIILHGIFPGCHTMQHYLGVQLCVCKIIGIHTSYTRRLFCNRTSGVSMRITRRTYHDKQPAIKLFGAGPGSKDVLRIDWQIYTIQVNNEV